MKYNYVDMEAVSVELSKSYRFYKNPNGDFYPSITTVLGDTISEEKRQSLTNWVESIGQDNANQITKEAAEKGTAVHLMIERMLMGEEIIGDDEYFTEDSLTSFLCLKPYLKKINEVWGNEVALCSHNLEIAGRCDCIGVYRGIPAIIDFKTSSKLKHDKDIHDYKLQLCAYAAMHNELYDTDISTGFILMASKNGFPQEFKVNLPDYFNELKDRVELFHNKLNKELL